jgi:hypothetical protein
VCLIIIGLQFQTSPQDGFCGIRVTQSPENRAENGENGLAFFDLQPSLKCGSRVDKLLKVIQAEPKEKPAIRPSRLSGDSSLSRDGGFRQEAGPAERPTVVLKVLSGRGTLNNLTERLNGPGPVSGLRRFIGSTQQLGNHGHPPPRADRGSGPPSGRRRLENSAVSDLGVTMNKS